MPAPSDPLYPSQWHFSLIGDIQTIWEEYTGNGVSVGVYDSGVDYNHEDLAANYDSSLHVRDNFGNPVDPFPFAGGAHGTACAGLIGAAADNGVGGVGVAYGVSLTGVNIFEDGTYGYVNGDTAAERAAFIDVIEQAAQFDVMSNSWGTTPIYGSHQSIFVAGQTQNLVNAYDLIATTGRGGLGTVNVQAAGNDDVNSNGDGANASRHTITVAATESDGTAASYTNFGSGILVAAPAGSVTTDISGTPGYDNGNYATGFGGTSAATPVTAGVISLMLEANPGLGWRDIQNILASSASHTGSAFGSGAMGYEDGAWYSTTAGNWNGGGHTFHNNYGYGMVNAFAAVRMAEVWHGMNGPAQISANELTVSADSGTINLGIPDYTTTTSTLTVGTNIEVETISVTLDMTHSYSGDLEIWLVAPDNSTRFMLMRNEGGSSLMDSGFEWQFEITGARGFSSMGDWTLEIIDEAGGDTGILSDWQLDFYGSTASTNDVHTITGEYLTLREVEAGRGTVTDYNGGTDWFNTVAIAADYFVNLATGRFGALGGAAWGSIWGAIENIAAGDGNDQLTGDGNVNRIMGMRGNDVIIGYAGSDSLFGNTGNDTLSGGLGNDLLGGADGNDSVVGGVGNDQGFGGFGEDTVAGGDGNDSLYGAADNDTVLGDAGNDSVFGNGGDDLIGGGDGYDSVDGGIGNDQGFGGFGEDTVAGGDGNDSLYGGANNDTVVGDAGNDSVFGNGGNDLVGGGDGYDSVDGGIGNDMVFGGNGNDRLIGDAGNDSLYGGANNDTVLGDAGNDSVLGDGGNDLVGGGNGNDLLGGGNGNDSLYGANNQDALFGGNGDDLLNGGAGLDTLTGGAGADILTGSAAADMFDFNFVSESTTANRDTISDFTSGIDEINLGTIDANILLGGNQEFSFINSAAFSGTAGELRFVTNGTDGFILGDVNGDAAQDLNIRLLEITSMNHGDFVL